MAINIDRWLRLMRKLTLMTLHGLRPSAIYGRAVGPKVLINSIPKSGTNLLEEVLHNCPLMRGKVQRTLLPSIDNDLLLKKVGAIKNGQCITSHLYYSESLMNALRLNDVKVIFIVRDLRDSLLSHITYLEKIDYTHHHTKIFEGCSTLDDKLNIYLNGSKEFEPWSEFVIKYHGWFSPDPRVLLVRFEDLIDTSYDCKLRVNTLQCIVDFLELDNVNIDRISKNMINESGLTYNAPSINKWKKLLSYDQKRMVNSSLSEVLSLFGYEEGLNE